MDRGNPTGEGDALLQRVALFSQAELNFQPLTAAVEGHDGPLVFPHGPRGKVPAIDNGGDAETHRSKTLVPVRPAEPDAYVQPDPLTGKIYSQEVGRGYTDGHGNIVMLMVAYGPVQNYRLKSHRPEICYTANGFRISDKASAAISYRNDAQPIKMTRLIAARESRFEPVTYWLRIGNDIANGVVDHQLSRLKYGLRGIIPDGALIRVSTIGLPKDVSFKLQDQFIRDLLAAIPPQELKFFTGAS